MAEKLKLRRPAAARERSATKRQRAGPLTVFLLIGSAKAGTVPSDLHGADAILKA